MAHGSRTSKLRCDFFKVLHSIRHKKSVKPNYCSLHDPRPSHCPPVETSNALASRRMYIVPLCYSYHWHIPMAIQQMRYV